MDAETRLDKRIEIAARIVSDLISKWDGFPSGDLGDRKYIGRAALDIADAIISEAENTN